MQVQIMVRVQKLERKRTRKTQQISTSMASGDPSQVDNHEDLPRPRSTSITPEMCIIGHGALTAEPEGRWGSNTGLQMAARRTLKLLSVSMMLSNAQRRSRMVHLRYWLLWMELAEHEGNVVATG